MGEREGGKQLIDFGQSEAPALEELGGASPLSVNFLADESGYITQFPGTSDWDWFPAAGYRPSQVDLITDFNGHLVWVTRDRYVSALRAPGLLLSLSDGTAATMLQGDRRPTSAKTRTRLFLAGGGKMQYWDGAALLSAAVTNGPITTHVVANSDRVVVIPYDVSGQMQWTAALEGEHLTVDGWDPLNFLTAEARPDRALALHENSNEVFLWGDETLEVFSPDAAVDYAPHDAINSGLGAPYSVISVLDRSVFAWLTQDKEFIVSNGRGDPALISRPAMAKVLRGLSTIDDCHGFRMRILNHDLLIWRFETAGRAFAFDLDRKRWFELRGYDSALGDWAPWPITAYHYWKDQDVHVVGLADGRIMKLDPEALTQAGQIIVCEAISGFLDGGDGRRRKQTGLLTAPMRRGGGTSTTDPPVVELFWRDSSPGAWRGPLRLPIGVGGDYKPKVKKRLVGRPYESRQWRLRASAGVGVSIGKLEEIFEMLEVN